MENIKRNRTILKAIADAVLYCGRQCIALRGHRESSSNPGNFLSLLRLLGRYDRTLQEHLSSPAMVGVTYMSPQTQNELLDVIGRQIILRHLLEEIKSAKFFTVLADEVTATNTEHLAICVRFVDCHKEIREEFLTFKNLSALLGSTSLMQSLPSCKKMVCKWRTSVAKATMERATCLLLELVFRQESRK